MQVGDTIHVFSSNAEEPLMCLAAILGGKMGGNWWVLVLNFTGSRVTWLKDERWHTKDDCTTDSDYNLGIEAVLDLFDVKDSNNG